MAFNLGRLVRLFMLALALAFAAAQPAAAQSVLRDSETELLFRELSKPIIEAAGVGLPVVLGYQAWTYWVFRRRLTAEPQHGEPAGVHA